MRRCRFLFFASLLCLAAQARTVVDLGGPGWTCDGVTVSVPHTWNAEDACDGPGDHADTWLGTKGGSSVRGEGYEHKRAHYRRALPAPKTGKRYFLKFDGVSVIADVEVNGHKVGRHYGAFTAFAFEITELLNADGANFLDIWADNRFDTRTQPMSADYSVFGGIYRNVWLVETDPVCIDLVTDGADGVRVVPNPLTGAVEMHVSVSGGTNEVQRFVVPNHELWSPENPKVYRRTVSICQQGSHDSVDVTFGFRTAEFRDGLFFLNGRQRKLRGVNRHQDREGKGWAVSAADEEDDIRLIKAMGADALRTAHYPQSRHVYDLCDELGLVCWVEYPNVNRLTFTDEYESIMRTQIREMLAQHRNHPCVAMWSIFNELYNGEEWMNAHAAEVNAMMSRTRDYIHSIDPSRPVVGVMGEAGRWLLNAIPDEYGLNVYPKWYSRLSMREMLDWLIVDTGRKTFAISEYGIGASVRHHGDPREKGSSREFHPEEFQAYMMHDNLLELQKEPRVWGMYVWAMFDFAADNRREGDRCGINDKGLVTYDHKTKKDAFYLYLANWTKTPVLHLVGSRMTETDRDSIYVMGFSNVGPVRLTVNGKDFGVREPDAACGVAWEHVPLSLGVNRVSLAAGGLTSEATWNRIRKETIK